MSKPDQVPEHVWEAFRTLIRPDQCMRIMNLSRYSNLRPAKLLTVAIDKGLDAMEVEVHEMQALP